MIFTKDNYLKRVSKKSFESNNLDSLPLKDNDEITFTSFSSSKNKLLFLTDQGNFILIPIYKLNELKWKDNPQHISELVKLNNNENIIKVFDLSNLSDYIYLNLITKNGIGKRVALSNFDTSKYSKTIRAINLKSSDKLVSASLSSNGYVNLIFTSSDLVIKISENDFPVLNTRSELVKIKLT